MEAPEQNSEKLKKNMQILEDIAKGMRADAKSSLESTLAGLKSLKANMDTETAVKMKEELEKSGTSFEILNEELAKFRKAASRTYGN